MANNNERNEIIRVFRKFARLSIDFERLNPMQAYKRIELLCTSRRSRLDMLAVYDMLRLLYLSDEAEIVDALYRVYFKGKGHRLTKHDIGARVLTLANENFCDERTIYRRLERARRLYERVRERVGLLEDDFGV